MVIIVIIEYQQVLTGVLVVIAVQSAHHGDEREHKLPLRRAAQRRGLYRSRPLREADRQWVSLGVWTAKVSRGFFFEGSCNVDGLSDVVLGAHDSDIPGRPTFTKVRIALVFMLPEHLLIRRVVL